MLEISTTQPSSGSVLSFLALRPSLTYIIGWPPVQSDDLHGDSFFCDGPFCVFSSHLEWNLFNLGFSELGFSAQTFLFFLGRHSASKAFRRSLSQPKTSKDLVFAIAWKHQARWTPATWALRWSWHFGRFTCDAWFQGFWIWKTNSSFNASKKWCTSTCNLFSTFLLFSFCAWVSPVSGLSSAVRKWESFDRCGASRATSKYTSSFTGLCWGRQFCFRCGASRFGMVAQNNFSCDLAAFLRIFAQREKTWILFIWIFANQVWNSLGLSIETMWSVYPYITTALMPCLFSGSSLRRGAGPGRLLARKKRWRNIRTVVTTLCRFFGTKTSPNSWQFFRTIWYCYFSVILFWISLCCSEFKTVKSVYETTPTEVLHEIVVVDDGSSMSDIFSESQVFVCSVLWLLFPRL